MRRSPTWLTAHRELLWTELQPALARTPALSAYAGRPLSMFPITRISDVRGNYGAWNSVGKSDGELRRLADAAESGEAQDDLSVGWSSGSGGGARGLFVADAAERADYIGQSLARLLPGRALLRRQRIALHLRAGSTLYSDAGRGRFRFQHFSLDPPTDQTMGDLRAFDPTILIAPPSRLLQFAKAGLRMPGLAHMFSGSEPMSDAEAAFIAERFGCAPRAIYQATEGFLGAECREGRLHLNDHALEIELEPVPGTSGFRPIITDLRRTSQPIVRFRGDDFIERDHRPCPCGYAGRVIHPIAGRVGDLWPIGHRWITPATVVATVEAELAGAQDWQAMANRKLIIVRVAPQCPSGLGERAAAALADRIGAPVTCQRDLDPWPGPKRRKVAWADG